MMIGITRVVAGFWHFKPASFLKYYKPCAILLLAAETALDGL
jgi:hypothetical protein